MLVSDRSLPELKGTAGNPLPYRGSVGTFWWGLAIGTLVNGPSCDEVGPLPALFLLIGGAAGLYFFWRVARRGLLVDVIFLWLPRPTIGIPLLGWLWFGNPLHGSLIERLVFVFSITGFAAALLASIQPGC
jgi:hypothetical protein